MSKLLIVETHPVQYRAPVNKRLAEIMPDALHVAYASDFSVRGGRDLPDSASISPGMAICLQVTRQLS
jgi:hypothetical protein